MGFWKRTISRPISYSRDTPSTTRHTTTCRQTMVQQGAGMSVGNSSGARVNGVQTQARFEDYQGEGAQRARR